MYETFFGLQRAPFELTSSPRSLVLTATHREALANLEYGITGRKGITVLTGDPGTGKTTLIRTAIERQPGHVHCVHLHNPALTRDEFVEMLAARFELSHEARASKAACILELEALLRQRHDTGAITVLVIDEAQSLSLELLEEIRLLSNVETSDVKLLTVVIAGQPELSARLNDPALRQLKQRVALRCELRALNLQETAGYIAGRIRAAGGVAAQLFTREAIAALFELSGGIPRTLSVLADNSLLTAFAAGQRPVTDQIVREVSRDFQIATVVTGGAETALAAATLAPAVVAAGPVPVVPGAVPAAAVPFRAPTSRLLTFESPQGGVSKIGAAAEAEPETLEAPAKRRWLSFLS
jgi:general secretion pathway protein A